MAVVYGILTSLCFAVASLFAQRGFHMARTPWGAWITLVVNTVFLFVVHFLLYNETQILLRANLIFVGVGLFVPGVTRVLTFRGIQTVGSTITSTIVNTTPLGSLFLAILLLGERPGALVVFGAAAIVGGVVLVSWAAEQRSWKKSELLYPLLAAVLFAIKDVTVRWGLSGGDGQPIFSAAVAALTSTLEVYGIIRYWQHVTFSWPAAKVFFWFVASGLFTGGSFLFMYLAYSLERVSIVGPLINSYAVFVLVLSPVLASQIETITWRKVFGALAVVAGVFFISLGR